MCTAVIFGKNNRYFGRNLDYERTFGEYVVVTPRNHELKFRFMPNVKSHAAFIGTAAVIDGYPLYYEATNEHGLSIAGLNFVGNCHFAKTTLDMCDNVCQFELIPYILGRCISVRETRQIIDRLNLVGERFAPELPIAELHWMIADKKECVVLEITEEGTRVYDDPFGVLTNNPPFYYHEKNICVYRSLSAKDRQQGFSDSFSLGAFSRGMGAMGLPGDWSSTSRFVRAAFVRANATFRQGSVKDEHAEINQFFHILRSVAMVDGCVGVENGFEYTQYSCCCDAQKGIYYFKRYEDVCLRAKDMRECDLDSKEIIRVAHKDCHAV
ncbi:MAG: choloylglycine hydrolase family protein [Ruminococcaceae bacterium]|nr:choloylglycine hydrolase family protein [Oscillospiraceae bacterium]